VAQQRPRAKVITPAGQRPRPQIYDPPESRDYKQHVAETVRAQALGVEVVGSDFTLPFKDVQCFLNLRFNIAKPVSYPARVTVHTKKPDFDNLAKGVLDGLVMAKILGDDGCVTDSTIMKRYVEPGHPEGVEIDLTVRPVEVV
jgi:Holliday junction resolvase RusA-like endonuclease